MLTMGYIGALVRAIVLGKVVYLMHTFLFYIEEHVNKPINGSEM